VIPGGDDVRRSSLLFLLVLSALLNVGVLGGAAYQWWLRNDTPDLARHLRLDADQRRRWEALEASFVRELDAGWREIGRHRERLIREVFSDRPDPATIESERASIAGLHAQQQQRVIAQLLRERDLLTAEQREALVQVLLREAPAAPLEQRLHGR
jgi:hypothetical protein